MILGDVILSYQDLVIFVLSIGGIACFRWILNNTRIGMAVRAVAQNPAGAQIVGIPKDVIFGATFAISTVMVGIGGILLSQKYFCISDRWMGHPGQIMGHHRVRRGMGSIRGSLYAAFILGMLEAFVGWIFGMTWVLFAMFGVLLIILAVRPRDY